MKRLESLIKGNLAVSLIAGLAFTSMSAKAAHELVYAVDFNNNLISFYSDAPGTVIGASAISGIQAAEEIRGIDFWGGTLYGLGSFSRLYTINPATGVATQIGGVFAPLLNGATFGTDNGSAGLQVISGLGQNLVIDRTTGLAVAFPNLAYAAGDTFFGVAPRADALAFDSAVGLWYASDTLQNTLATLNPATGVLNTIGPLGIDASRYNGLDISPSTGIMYMGTPAASSDPQANFYTVDKVTGMTTLVGLIGNPGDGWLVRGIAVIPEPGSMALIALGTLSFWIARRRQQ